MGASLWMSKDGWVLPNFIWNTLCSVHGACYIYSKELYACEMQLRRCKSPKITYYFFRLALCMYKVEVSDVANMQQEVYMHINHEPILHSSSPPPPWSSFAADDMSAVEAVESSSFKNWLILFHTFYQLSLFANIQQISLSNSEYTNFRSERKGWGMLLKWGMYTGGLHVLL